MKSLHYKLITKRYSQAQRDVVEIDITKLLGAYSFVKKFSKVPGCFEYMGIFTRKGKSVAYFNFNTGTREHV